MNCLIRGLLSLLLVSQSVAASAIPSQQETTKRPGQTATIDPKTTLEDGTPVKLRISQTISSADAHLNDRVEFEALEDVLVDGAVIIPKGGIAWGTVTEAKSKRWAGRGGKLEIVMDSVRLVDGERAALRATKEVKGGSHSGAMTIGIVASGVLFFPVAPLFLFIHGKDITIPKGTELQTFINGNVSLDMAKFKPAESTTPPPQANSETEAPDQCKIAVASTPSGADIELDGAYVGNTPSTIMVTVGDHTVALKKSGFELWQRTIKVSGGTVQISGELQEGDEAPIQPTR